MNIIEQQVLIGVAIVVIAAIVIGVGKFVLGTAQELKDGQVDIKENCQDIALTLRGFEGRFMQGEQWMELHQKSDDESFATLREQHRDIKGTIEEHRREHHGG
jgi:hypothetical protein